MIIDHTKLREVDLLHVGNTPQYMPDDQSHDSHIHAVFSTRLKATTHVLLNIQTDQLWVFFDKTDDRSQVLQSHILAKVQ